jgi:membrane-associated phospholipid phosphatase
MLTLSKVGVSQLARAEQTVESEDIGRESNGNGRTAPFANSEKEGQVPRWLLVLQLSYVVSVSIWVVARGGFPGIGFLACCLFLSLIWFASLRGFLISILPLVALLVCYQQLRTVSDEITPFSVHITDLIGVERFLFFGHIPSVVLQYLWPPDSLSGSILWRLSTIVYGSHFVTPIALALTLWAKDKVVYWRFIGGLILTSYIGFFGYLLFPAAPPWWAHQFGYIHESLLSPIDARLLPLIPNPVAAMPSLHAAYALYCGWFIGRSWPKLGFAVVLLPLVMCFATIYLAHHYVIDHVAGWILVLVVLCLLRFVPKRFAKNVP